jgi:transcriptional regulator with XRE-family HTH domain
LPRITIDVRALYAALKSKRAAADQSWRDVAAELGISPSTFTRMAQGGRPDIDTFATLLHWLNMPATAYMKGGGDRDDEETEPLVAIASLLRSSRSVNAHQADTLENIIAAAYKSITRSKGDDARPGHTSLGRRV